MEKILVATFEDEPKAYEGLKALQRLDADGSIALHQSALVQKKPDGSWAIPQSMEGLPVETLGGTAVGALIGLLGGPVGAAIGATTGMVLGMAGDLAVGTIDQRFLEQVQGELKPGTSALVVDLTEEWTTPVDVELQPFSSNIFRRARVDVEDAVISERIETHERELEALEKEAAEAHAERKAKVQARIAEVKATLKDDRARFEEKRKRRQEETRTKLEAQRKKISSAASGVKGRIQARLDDLERRDREFTQRTDKAVADHLRRLADRVERRPS